MCSARKEIMRKHFHLTATVILALMSLLLIASRAQAQDGARAGVIVVHGDGSVTQQCVRFDEESISGYELLKRAGLTLGVEASSTGASVCSIDGEGCNFPQESCFCKCLLCLLLSFGSSNLIAKLSL